MRSRIIVSSNGQTLVARGKEYVAPSQSGITVLTSRQFEENRVYNKGPVSSGTILERAAIYGNPRAVSKSELKRAARLEKARSVPVISQAEALSIIESLKRADEMKARQAARLKEREEEVRREEMEEAKEARRKVAETRLNTLRGLNKSA